VVYPYNPTHPPVKVTFTSPTTRGELGGSRASHLLSSDFKDGGKRENCHAQSEICHCQVDNQVMCWTSQVWAQGDGHEDKDVPTNRQEDYDPKCESLWKPNRQLNRIIHADLRQVRPLIPGTGHIGKSLVQDYLKNIQLEMECHILLVNSVFVEPWRLFSQLFSAWRIFIINSDRVASPSGTIKFTPVNKMSGIKVSHRQDWRWD